LPLDGRNNDAYRVRCVTLTARAAASSEMGDCRRALPAWPRPLGADTSRSAANSRRHPAFHRSGHLQPASFQAIEQRGALGIAQGAGNRAQSDGRKRNGTHGHFGRAPRQFGPETKGYTGVSLDSFGWKFARTKTFKAGRSMSAPRSRSLRSGRGDSWRSGNGGMRRKWRLGSSGCSNATQFPLDLQLIAGTRIADSFLCMAVKYSQIAELLGIVVRHVGRTRYEAMIKDIKASQAYRKNQSFRETMERMERQLKTGKARPPKQTPGGPPSSSRPGRK